MTPRTLALLPLFVTITLFPAEPVAADYPGHLVDKDRVRKCLSTLRDTDWRQLESEPTVSYAAAMVDDRREIGDFIYVLLIVRDPSAERDANGRPVWRIFDFRQQNLKLVDGEGALVPTTLKWRWYAPQPVNFNPGMFWRPGRVGFFGSTTDAAGATDDLQVWTFEIGEIFDLSRPGPYRLEFVPTFSVPDVPFGTLTFRLNDSEEE